MNERSLGIVIDKVICVWKAQDNCGEEIPCMRQVLTNWRKMSGVPIEGEAGMIVVSEHSIRVAGIAFVRTMPPQGAAVDVLSSWQEDVTVSHPACCTT